jgi:hypothetical protein
MPIFLAMGGFVIEGGHMFVAKRHLQNAADAAALAAARDLPGDGSPCTGSCLVQVKKDVTEYAGYNNFFLSPPKFFHACDPADSTDTNCFETPHNGSNDLIQVRVTETLAPIFANALGMGPFKISARATASAGAQTIVSSSPDYTGPGSTTTDVIPGSTTVVTNPSSTTVLTTPDGTTTVVTPGSTTTIVTPPTTTYSISTQTVLGPGSGNGGVAFAMSAQCKDSTTPAAISYTGAGGKGTPFTVGSLETNGGIEVSGNLKTVSWLAWGKRGNPGCDLISGQGSVTTQLGPFAHLDWPIPPPTAANSGCTHVASQAAALAAGPGIYCVNGNLSFTGGNLLGYSWFATGSISIGSTNQRFSAAASSPSQAIFVAGGNITISGNGNTIDGSMFAPNGTFSISGGGATGGSGFIEAQTVALSGNLSTYTGTGGFGNGSLQTTTITTSTTIPGSTTVVTTPDSTTTSTIPGGTSTVTTPGGTTTVTTPDGTTTITTPGLTITGSTTTITTGTTIGMNE